MDESAKMLMLLGELGGDEEDDLADDASDDDGDGSSPAKITPSKRKKPERPSANGHGVGVAGDGALATTQSGPVGEWLKAEGEARMKMADHRRLIYRWTNAILPPAGDEDPARHGFAVR